MGECILIKSGASGISSDECTASRDKVLSGYTAVTSDSNDEAILGTMPTYGAQTITPALTSQTVSCNGKYMTGNVTVNAIPNQRGSAVKGISCGVNSNGLYYYIYPGYYQEGSSNPWVYMTINEAVNAIGIQSIVSFSIAQYSNKTILGTWAKPSKGPWSGVRIMCKQGSYPSNASDGICFYDGNGTSAMATLAIGLWYFRAWNYISTSSSGRVYGNYIDAGCTNTEIRGQQTFTSSGIFTVPNAVRSIDIFCIGGGAAGGWGTKGASYAVAGTGGGSGYTATKKGISVFPGENLSIAIGAGGISNQNVHSLLRNGSVTSIIKDGATLLSAAGGRNTQDENNSNYSGGNGGSGGGGSGYNISSTSNVISGGVGGADGENGGESPYATPSVSSGQGSTTRAFGEPSNTLYGGAGGGGAGSRSNSAYFIPGGAGGAGGGGAGGNGGANYTPGTNGSAGSGGGGGGGGNKTNNDAKTGGDGGSGIVIIRWGY